MIRASGGLSDSHCLETSNSTVRGLGFKSRLGPLHSFFLPFEIIETQRLLNMFLSYFLFLKAEFVVISILLVLFYIVVKYIYFSSLSKQVAVKYYIMWARWVRCQWLFLCGYRITHSWHCRWPALKRSYKTDFKSKKSIIGWVAERSKAVDSRNTTFFHTVMCGDFYSRKRRAFESRPSQNYIFVPRRSSFLHNQY
jgi:hypothetical protein